MKTNNKNKSKHNQIILRQNNEIENLKSKISELEINAINKDELTKTLDNINTEWINLINEIESKCQECERLISDLKTIKNIMRSSGFKQPWYNRLRSKFI